MPRWKRVFLSCGIILLGAVHLSCIEIDGLALLGYDCANFYFGSMVMYFKQTIEVQVGQQYFTSYHMFDSIKNPFWCSSFQSYLTFLEVKAVNWARSSERFCHMPQQKLIIPINWRNCLRVFWDCEGLNGLYFLWYGHKPVTSDVITQIVKFVGAKA